MVVAGPMTRKASDLLPLMKVNEREQEVHYTEQLN